MSKISRIQADSYQQEIINEAVKRHFEEFHLKDRLCEESKVLIKPNLLMKRKPEEFTTTHPSLVEAAIIALKEMGVTRITVADSPGGLYNVSALKGIYDSSGMTEVCARQEVVLNEDVTFRELFNENAKLVKSFPIIKPVCDADFIIDICKLKTHAMTGMSGGVKNLFGCIPGLTKPEFHWRFPEKEFFCEMLIDLCETVNPDFVLVDAVVSMEGNGPSGGTAKNTGVIFASDHVYDLDYYLSYFIGAEPEKIMTVKAAMDRGLCCTSLTELEFVGDESSISPFEMPESKSLDFMSHMPKLIRKPAKAITKSFFTSKPVVRKKDCIGCGKCAESCPAKTIRLENRKAVISYKKCIHCFCCHEMCPVKAIDLKRSRLLSKL